MTNVNVQRLPIPFQVQDSVSPKDYKSGTFALNWNEKYAAEMLLRWRFNVDANPTGFNLWFGVRQNGIIKYSNVVMELNYQHLGISDVDTELYQIGIFPECGISVSTKGVTVLYALYPSLDQTIIELLGTPRFDIDCLMIGGDNWYSSNNRDWQKVEDGTLVGRGLRYLACPLLIDDMRQPLYTRLYCTAWDTLDADADHFYTLTRHP